MPTEPRAGVVLFRVAAGPRVGFGHLVRSLVLARTLGRDCRFSVRGTAGARAAAKRLGARLVPGERPAAVLRSVRAALLVIDDRVPARTAPWRRAARAAGVPLASIHDLGIGLGDADLVIDGSIRPPSRVPPRSCLGPSFAVLRPLGRIRRGHAVNRPARLLIALGGGPRRRLAAAVADSIAERFPDLRVEVAGGFLSTPRRLGTKRAIAGARVPRVLPVSPAGFDAALARADLAIVAGGMTLYEACSLGVPSVAVAVAPSQRPTIAAFAARGAAVDGGLVSGRPRAGGLVAITRALERLIADRRWRARLSHRGRRLVDGGGARRVANALRALAAGPPPRGIVR